MGIVERKEREKRMRRDMILEASEVVFVEKGLRAATLDEIAEKAEVSKGTIYLYFSSKEDLYFSLMIRGLSLLLKMFQEARPEEVPPTEALYRLGDVYYKFSREQSYLFRMLAAVENPDVNGQVSREVLSQLEETSNRVLSYVAQFVQKGIDEGVFRNDVSSHEAVILFWISLNGILNMKERSSAMIKNNCSDKNSILSTVDFDSLYKKNQKYLLDFLTRNVTPSEAQSNSGRKPKEASKHSKTVTRK